MDCIICKNGRTQAGLVTVTLQRGGCTVVIKDVTADVCENCGEYYLQPNVSEAILAKAEAAAQQGTEVEIMRFVA